jgi:hypothetical protein
MWSGSRKPDEEGLPNGAWIGGAEDLEIDRQQNLDNG